MIQLQNHRGPDANGVFEDRKCNVIFGHNRLSILELSDAGAQPMFDQSKNWVISYNGELYNYQKIKQELIERFSVKFKGNSDTEVVLYGVIHFGIDEFLRKRCMFPLLFSIGVERSFLARDRVGEKPLYFKSKEGLSFASELKVLREIFDGNLGIDTTGLQLYLICVIFRRRIQFFRAFQNWRRDTICVFQIKTKRLSKSHTFPGIHMHPKFPLTRKIIRWLLRQLQIC